MSILQKLFNPRPAPVKKVPVTVKQSFPASRTCPRSDVVYMSEERARVYNRMTEHGAQMDRTAAEHPCFKHRT